MFGLQTLTFAILAALIVATTEADQRVSFTYRYNPVDAGGVSGTITVVYPSNKSSRATISADLDFSGVKLSELQMADANCTTFPTEFAWHIHVKWSSTKTSAKYAMCSLANNGNHYDPNFACGPNSEFAMTPTCIPKILNYNCNPLTYAANPQVCEKGDLSGKLGKFKLDNRKRVYGSWVDFHYPLVSENTPQWNFILHAVCGKNPRVACALGAKKTEKGY